MMVLALLIGSLAFDILSIGAVLWCLADALADLRDSQALGLRNGRLTVARSDLRGQAIRLVIVMILGAIVMFLLPFVDVTTAPEPQIVMVFVLFGSVNLLMSINAVMDLTARRRLAEQSRHKP